MPSDDSLRGLAKRLGLTLVVTIVVLFVSASSSFVLSESSTADSLEVPEYSRDSMAVDPLRAEGQIAVGANQTNGGRIVVDSDHGNNVARAEFEPLAKALSLSGHDVVYFDGGNLSDVLDGATAFVLLDPASEYDAAELATLHSFTDSGGRLLVVAEPDHREVSATLFGTSVSTDSSAVTTVGASYGLSFGTQYLYDLDENDGNYRHVLAVPVGEGFDDTDRVTLYTATTVDSRDGTPILTTVPTTRLSASDEQRSYVVGVVDGNVMALGDASFLAAGRHNVADNERFLATVVEFLVSGERGDIEVADGEPASGGSDTGSDGAANDETPGGETDGNETEGDDNETTTPAEPTATPTEPTPVRPNGMLLGRAS